MPRGNSCQHPTQHIEPSRAPIGHNRVSLRLSKFIRDQYDLDETKITMLCSRCHIFETKDMNEDESMESEENYDSSDEEEKAEYDDGGDNDNHDDDDNNNDDDDNNNDDDDNNNDDDDNNNDDDSDDDTLYELTFKQEETMKKLSTIFRILNIDPIHDT